MTENSSVATPPPVTEKRASEKRVHGVSLIDDYAWLKAENWQEVLRNPAALPKDIRAVLEAENAYSKACLAPTIELQTKLIAEMRGRIKEDDADVPLADGDWLYYDRHREGGQHPLICRRPRTGGEGEGTGAEIILLDGDEEGRGKAFFDIGERAMRPITPSSPGVSMPRAPAFIRSWCAISRRAGRDGCRAQYGWHDCLDGRFAWVLLCARSMTITERASLPSQDRDGPRRMSSSSKNSIPNGSSI